MAPASNNHYKNFAVSIYTRAYEVRDEMADLDQLAATWDIVSRYLKVDKIYLETHRDVVIPDRSVIEGAKQFFADQGVETAGGITYTVNERNRFETYCYTRPDHRQKVREIAEYTASLFDAFILDDFFFTDCKCPACIEAKGDRSWSEFRLALMADAARDLVLEPARAVNPKVKVVIKYPNWFEHFHELGFNLELQPAMFDGIYTGTETRHAILSNQHLQPYHGYSIVRYFANTARNAGKPEGNRGGWVDPFGSDTADRYGEQLWLTLFAKAPECTLFDWRSIRRPLEAAMRAPWQSAPRYPGIGVDFDAMVMPTLTDSGELGEGATVALAAGHAFEQADAVLGELGAPVGIPSYRPFHADGEDFLHSYLGMIGLPIELTPDFPADAGTILLTEAAKKDPKIADRIKAHLLAGKNVVVTSGLYAALQGKPAGAGARIEDIVSLEVTGSKALVRDYLAGWRERVKGDDAILVPHIRYYTNDSWELVSGLTATTGHPILHYASYADAAFYVLTIPDNFDDLNKLPQEVLAHIRRVVAADMPVRLDAPPQVMLFLYDNDTLLVESCLDEIVDFGLIVKGEAATMTDITTGEALAGVEVPGFFGRPSGEVRFTAELAPHTFRVFRHTQ